MIRASALALAIASAAIAPPAFAFTDAQVAEILTHGPWPIPWTRDPSNRVSGEPLAIDLGERLFFERRLSVSGTVSCSLCHLPERNWTDGEARARGLALTDRNAPSLANVRYQRWFGWDGANDSLWSQSIRPLLDEREFGSSAERVARLIREDRDLSCRYEKVFGAPPPAEDQSVLVGVGKALAAFQETIVTSRTPFDDLRDALARGDEKAVERYPQAARRGLAIFIGKGACALCHVGPAFTNNEFHDDAVPFSAGSGRADPGRYGGIEKLLASPFNLLGSYNDDPVRAPGISTRHVVLEYRNLGEFKTPSLRKLALTAPYMHNGRAATLRDVVRHYSEIDPDLLHSYGERILKPLHLSDEESDDLLAFLQTLQDAGPDYRRRPFPENCLR